ncbi:MAG: HAD family hydrolase [Actinomycetaceae bacterium]|nr:HAD family hydrolase [Actinomycetaceae bacterium]
MKRLVFLDLDGTVVSEDQTVPDSARKAMREAVENGHVLWMCTGRSLPEIYPWLWDLGFQGFIGANGTYARLDGKDLFNHMFPRDFIDRAEAYFKENGILSLWQNQEAMYPTKGYFETFFESNPDAREKWATFLNHVEPYIREGLPDGASKAMMVIPEEVPLSIEQVEAHFEGELVIIPASIDTGVAKAGEVLQPAYNKGTALVEVANVLGFPIEQTVAVGDALNDLQMVSEAGLGIAMGNAVPEVKAAADFVSTPIWEDGLVNAFKHAGLI